MCVCVCLCILNVISVADRQPAPHPPPQRLIKCSSISSWQNVSIFYCQTLPPSSSRHTTQDTRQRTQRMLRPAAAALVKLPKFASHVAAAVAAPEPPSCRHWNAPSMYFPNHHSCQYPHFCCSFYPEQQTIYANSCTAHRTLLRRAKCKKSTRTHCRCHFNDKFQHTHTHRYTHWNTWALGWKATE